MKIRIMAGYAATDGRMPESLEVEIETEAPTVTAEVTATIGHVLGQMIGAPAARELAATSAAFESAFAKGGLVKATEAVSVYQCRRTLCGHAREAHGATDDQGNRLGMGAGACLVCVNSDKCRSFVGEGAER